MAECNTVLSLLCVVLALLHTATPEACGPADVMFVLSANHTIDRAEFDQKIQMIQEYVNSVNIGPGPNDTRVGLISEYDWADLEFHMDDHMERNELLDRLKFVYFGKGQNGVGVGTALEYINMEGMNTHLGGRSGVQDVVIFLTTNNPNASALAKQESTFLQLTGVTQIGAGVGPWDKLDNLNVASGCHYVTQTTDTLNSTGAHTYLVESMVNLTCDAVNKVDCCDCCELPKCCPKILDVLYLVDATNSDGQTKLKYQYQIDYLEEMTKALQMDINETKVEAVTYATHPHPQFDLDAYPNKTDLIKALSFLPYQYGGRNITEALQYVDATSFPERMHDNKPVERVVVLTTVGPYGLDMAAAIAEADRLKQLGIKVVSIGVDGALKNEYPQLATGSNWLHFPDYTDMVTGVPDGLDRLCSSAYDAPGLTPAPNAATSQAPAVSQPTNAPSGGNPSPTQAPVSTTPQPTTPTTMPTTTIPTTTTPATTTTTTTTTTTPPTTTAGGLCIYHPCQNGATCVFNDVTSKTTCICTPGWRGETCHIQCNSMASDVVFVLDASSSEGLANFNKQLGFVEDVVKSMDIGPDAVQMALVTYASTTRGIFDLKDHATEQELIDAIRKTKYDGGLTMTNLALEYTTEQVLSPANGRRLDAQAVVIVMTDGESLDAAATKSEAQRLKDTGAVVIAIGVGNETISDEELTAIATDDSHKFRIQFDSLIDIQGDIVATTCSGGNATAPGNATMVAPTSPPTSKLTITPTSPTIPPTPPPLCIPNPCMNGGTCLSDGANGFRCHCPNGASGAFCFTTDAPPAPNALPDDANLQLLGEED